MIFGVGIDLISIHRVEKVFFRHGNSFAKKILTNKELIGFEAASNKARFLAQKFSIKEAFSKALGTGISSKCRFKDITVNKNPLGKPEILLEAPLIHRSHKIHVSVSDEKDFLTSLVIIELF